MSRWIVDTDARTVTPVIEPEPPPAPDSPQTLEEALDRAFGGMLVDLRGKLPGSGYARGLDPRSPQTAITLHHSASGHRATWSGIARYHVDTRGWPGIGYHFGIDPAGVVSWLGDIATIRYHTGATNNKRIGVCLLGQYHPRSEGYNGPPPVPQVEAFRKLRRTLGEFYGRSLPIVLHRSERPTACPGDDLAALVPGGSVEMIEDIKAATAEYERAAAGRWARVSNAGFPMEVADMFKKGLAGIKGWRTGLVALALIILGVAEVLGWDAPGEDSQRLIDFATQPATVGLVMVWLRDITDGVAAWRKRRADVPEDAP